jgi:Histidine kinase-, DNA gyrase B-, and HSP90-like ATPase
MSSERIKNTTIWQSSLGMNDEKNNEQLERLRVSLSDMRKKVAVLTNQISSDFKQLTQHDVSHLDALWVTTSTIIGEDYKINPLEAYVLGASILLHDSALSFAAYEGGVTEIRNSKIWLDLHEENKRKNPSKSQEELSAICDFISIRYLHSEQAKSLTSRIWKNPKDGSQLFIIEDSELRTSYGELIGEIAASHHWEIEKLSSIRSQINAIPGFPKEWKVNGQKLACILRCADAAHIDSERAPTFLFALYERNGVSFNHWLAQNKMAQVDIYENDSSNETLLFTSTSAFNENEADAWWVMYDALTLIGKELNASNAFLESNFGENLIFKAKRVYGLESLETLCSVIQVKGWKPNSTELHVGNIERLIKNLGGEKLYTQKDKFMVAIRELIQNSADAVRARRLLDKSYDGKILIEIEKDISGTFLKIIDDGVGMSKRVLTGSLLDFGTSFWSSSIIKDEFPGLLSSNYKSIGQFGIGFYSIFMIAESVTVTSRRFDSAYNSALSLLFKNGLSLRPLLKENEKTPDGFSTVIKLKLKEGILDPLDEVEILSNPPLNPNFKVPFDVYLSSIFPGLDVNVNLRINEIETKIHTSLKDSDFNLEEWFKRLSFCDYQSNDNIKLYIQQNIERLEYLYDDDHIIGLAAISTTQDNGCNYLNNRTIGGLTVDVHERRSNIFIGFLNHEATFANRTTNKIDISDITLNKWVTSQKAKLNPENLDPISRIAIMSNLIELQADPIDYFGLIAFKNNIPLFLTKENFFETIADSGIVFLVGVPYKYLGQHFNYTSYKDYVLYKPITAGTVNLVKLDKDYTPISDNSLLYCIVRLAKLRNIELEWNLSNEIINGTLESYNPLICKIKKFD